MPGPYLRFLFAKKTTYGVLRNQCRSAGIAVTPDVSVRSCKNLLLRVNYCGTISCGQKWLQK